MIGRAEVIGSVPVPDIAAYHDQRYPPSNIVVAAAGSLEHDRIVALVEGALEGGAGATAPEPEPAPADPEPSLRFHAKDTEQYHLSLGGPGVARADERRFALRVLDTILGGSTSSRLFQEVREKRGLAYAVYSYSSQYADSGHVGVYVGTRPDNVGEAMDVIGTELRRIAEEAVSEEELDRARENVKGRTVLSMESTLARMNRLGSSLLMGVPLLSLDEVLAAIDAVTMEDVRALAAELFDPARMSAAGVGADEDAFRSALEPVNPALRGRVIFVGVSGAAGRMGETVCSAVEGAEDMELSGRADPALGTELGEILGDAEVVVDFSQPDTALANARACLEAGVHCVMGTTGADFSELEGVGGANLFVAPNFAIGAVLMMEAAKLVAPHMPECEIMELHHDQKLDAPSGTAARTAELIEAAGGNVHEPIHSVRLRGLVAHQEVLFGGEGQTLSIRHDSISRESFMPGVLLAVRRVGSLERSPTVGLETAALRARAFSSTFCAQDLRNSCRSSHGGLAIGRCSRTAAPQREPAPRRRARAWPWVDRGADAVREAVSALQGDPSLVLLFPDGSLDAAHASSRPARVGPGRRGRGHDRQRRDRARRADRAWLLGDGVRLRGGGGRGRGRAGVRRSAQPPAPTPRQRRCATWTCRPAIRC